MLQLHRRLPMNNAFGRSLGLVCLDAKTGELKWKVDMVQQHGAYDITFGMGATPRRVGDKVIVSYMTKGASYVVALNAKTGELVWKHDRRFPAKDDGPDAYSTPALIDVAGKQQLVVITLTHMIRKTGISFGIPAGFRLPVLTAV